LLAGWQTFCPCKSACTPSQAKPLQSMMESSAVTPMLLKSFKVAQLVYKHWIPYFVDYDTESNKIQLKVEEYQGKLITWCFVQFFILFCSFVLCIHYPLKEKLSPVETLPPAVISFSIRYAALGIMEMSITCIIWGHLWEFHQSFNRFMDIEISVTNGTFIY